MFSTAQPALHSAGLLRLPALTWLVIGLVALMTGIVFLGPVLVPYDPYQFSVDINQGPSAAHLLGTDDQGRDVFSRLIAGTRLSLFFGGSAALVALALGGLAAMVALAFGRAAESAVFALVDLLRAMPDILFALAFIAAFEPGAGSVILALGISFSPYFALITRATYHQQAARPYVAAARVLGAGRLRTALRHILPNILGALITQFAIILPRCIVSESVLSFLGLGVSPDTPTWGRMIANATGFTESAPHAVLAPLLTLSLATFCFAMLGDLLRRRFDPTRRRLSL